MIRTRKIKGYTLAELLITIAVVGVLAVVLLSALKKSHQDKDKLLYLKTSMRLSNIISTLVNDNVAYPDKDDEYIYSNALFYNTYINENYAKKWKISSGKNNSKLCRLIAEKGYRADGSNCSDSNDDIPEYKDIDASKPSFSTHDGIDFYVYTKKTELVQNSKTSNLEGGYKTILYVDVNGNKKGNNCIFDRNSCINPDVHKFLILADGQIRPMDQMGIYYTKTSSDLKKHTFNEKLDEDKVLLDKIESLLTKEDIIKFGDSAKAVISPIVATGDSSDFTSLSGDDMANADYDDSNSEIYIKHDGEDILQESSSFENYDGTVSCEDISCKYNCSRNRLNAGYGSYDSGGGCQDGTTIMYKDEHIDTYWNAKQYCEDIGGRLPTVHELSAAGNFFSEMGLHNGNYWADEQDPNSLRDGTVANCFLPDGNCGTHSASDKQYFRCISK